MSVVGRGITRIGVRRSIVYIFRLSVLSYFFVRISYYLGRQWTYENGDEDVFREDLEFIQQQGWSDAIESGISVPYMLVAYPFSVFLEPISALRAANVAIFAAFLVYFWKVRGIKDPDFFLLILFVFSTFGYFFSGVNDTLFAVTLGVFLAETHFILTDRRPASLLLWGTGLVLAAFTRSLILVFLPVIILAIVWVARTGRAQAKTLVFPAMLAVVLLAINLPSLTTSGAPSYEQKPPPDRVDATWTQAQYLAQLMTNDGLELSPGELPSWDETQRYLDVNGPDSLPATIPESITRDIPFTLNEFVKDFPFGLIEASRKLGLILLILTVILVRDIVRDRTLKPADFIPIALIGTIATFAMIIISFVQTRWFGPVFFVAILNFHLRGRSGEIPSWLVVANYGVTAILSWQGMYRLIDQAILSA